MRQNRLEMGRHPRAFGKAAFAIRVPAKSPEVRPVIDIERHLPASLARHAHRRKAGSGDKVGAEMRSRDENRLRRGNEVRVYVGFRDRHVGTVLAIENKRKLRAVPNAEDHQCRQSRRVGDHMACLDTLAIQRLADETAHMFVTDTGDQCRFQPEPRTTDADIGRAAADIFGKARHVLEPAADLAAIEING